MQGNTIRNAIRAILIEDGKILLCKYRDSEGVFFACIGGGQNTFEDMHTALARECREEINSEINIGNLVFVREAFFENEDGNDPLETIHQIEYFFKCTLKPHQEVRVGPNPDANSLGIEWVAIDKLNGIRIYPAVFKDYIHSDGTMQNIVYLGLGD